MFLLNPSVIYIEIVYNKKGIIAMFMSLDLDLRGIFCLKESILCSSFNFWNQKQDSDYGMHCNLSLSTCTSN